MPRPLAIVTGASSGIGAEFARQLAKRGYDLLLVARRLDRLDALARELSLTGVQCQSLAADLTLDADLAMVSQRVRSADALSLLVNNAGFGTLGNFAATPLDGQDKMHRLHVMATLHLCHAALPAMVARDAGAIINVASVAGFAQSAGNTSYCATKAWMNVFTEGLFLELAGAQSHVTVQALCPGFTRSEFHATLHMDTSGIPGFLWLPAERVVRESLDALKSRKLFVIPGKRYQIGVALYRAIPRSLQHWWAFQGARIRNRMNKHP